MNKLIQSKWREGYVIGFDCLAYGDGRVVIAHTYTLYDPNTDVTQRFWSPLCDTTLEGMTKYDEDIWTAVDIFHGTFEFEGQTIVFGDGGMGNEGFVASVGPDNTLNWSLFSVFSNPIMKAEMKDRTLICHGETGLQMAINIDNPTNVKITLPPPFLKRS